MRLIRKSPEDEMKKKLNNPEGVTFVELLIVLIIFSIILLMTIPFIRSIDTAWNLGDKRAEIMQNARIALDRMAKRIENSTEIISVTAASDANGMIVVRNYDDVSTDTFSRNTVSSTLDWNSAALADNITSLKFTCYESDCITQTTDPKEIKAIDMEIVVTDPNNDIAPMKFYTRSFKRTDEVVVGMVAYGEGTVRTPRYRIWNGHTWSAEANALDMGGTIYWIALKACPLRNEFILGTVGSATDVNVQVYDGNSKTWGNLVEMTRTASINSRRCFDIAYESSTGNAIVVYGVNSNNPNYYVWDGSSWSGPTAIALGASGRPYWVKLRANPDTTSNEIILVTLDSANDVRAAVWNGSSWGSVQLMENNVGSSAYEDADVAYEPISKRAMVIWSQNGNVTPQYRVWSSGSWSAEYNATALTAQPRWIQLSPSSSMDSIVFGSLDGSSDVSANTFASIVSWGNDVRVEQTAEVATRRCFDVGFEAFDRTAIICWSLSSNHYIQYRLCSKNSNWPTTLTGPDLGNDIQIVALYPDFKTNDIMMGTITDDGDLEFTMWNKGSWGTPNKLCVNISTQLYEPFMFAYRKN